MANITGTIESAPEKEIINIIADAIGNAKGSPDLNRQFDLIAAEAVLAAIHAAGYRIIIH